MRCFGLPARPVVPEQETFFSSSRIGLRLKAGNSVTLYLPRSVTLYGAAMITSLAYSLKVCSSAL